MPVGTVTVMRWVKSFMCGWILLSAPCHSESGVAASAGKTFSATCASCHGDRAQGNRALQSPALTALGPAYLQRQLQDFISGRRGSHPQDIYGAQMRAAVGPLGSGSGVNALAAYIESLPAVAPKATVEGDLKRGKDFYTMICGACHGAKAEGNIPLQSPALAGTDDWYLLRQMQNFRAGIRGGDADDVLGQQMRSMAMTLPDEATVRDVIAYIQSLVVPQ